MRNRRLAKKKRLEREAEEIMARLRAPFARKPTFFEATWIHDTDVNYMYSEKLSEALVKSIAAEIDREIMEKLREVK